MDQNTTGSTISMRGATVSMRLNAPRFTRPRQLPGSDLEAHVRAKLDKEASRVRTRHQYGRLLAR